MKTLCYIFLFVS